MKSLIPHEAMGVVGQAGLTAQDAEMERNIGREIAFTNWKPRMGTARRDYTFTIVGIQKDFEGKLAYRVVCNGYNDTFGSVAQVNAFKFID